MELNNPTTAALDAASSTFGDDPVTMVDLLRFRDAVPCPAGLEGTRGLTAATTETRHAR